MNFLRISWWIFFPFPLIYNFSLLETEVSFPFLMQLYLYQHHLFLNYSFIFNIFWDILTFLFSVINYHLLYHFFFLISLGVWDSTKSIYLGRKIYIFMIFSFAFRGQGVSPFTQMCSYNSRFYRFSFHMCPNFSIDTCPALYLPPPHVVINDLTSSVVFVTIL